MFGILEKGARFHLWGILRNYVITFYGHYVCSRMVIELDGLILS